MSGGRGIKSGWKLTVLGEFIGLLTPGAVTTVIESRSYSYRCGFLVCIGGPRYFRGGSYVTLGLGSGRRNNVLVILTFVMLDR